MEKSKIDKDWPSIKKSWEIFMRLVRGEISDLEKEQNKLEIEIKKIEHLLKLIESSFNDINALLSHEKIFLNAYPQFEKEIEILKRFKEKDNLDNDIAVSFYNKIINGLRKENLEEVYNDLLVKSNQLQDRILKLNDLKNGEDYSLELITELINKYNLANASHLIIYPIKKTLRKEPIKKEKVNSNEEQNKEEEKIVSAESIMSEMEIIEHPEVTIPVLDEAIEHIDQIYSQVDISNYKSDYDLLKKEYDEFIKDNNLLFSKYYTKLNEMTTIEKQYYKSYCSYSKEQIDELEQFGSEYNNAASIILAIKLFDMKKEIDNTIKTIVDNNYESKDFIEFFEECIMEIKNICDGLSIVDRKIETIEKEMVLSKGEESKVFFATDKYGNTFIPKEFKSGVNQRKLITIMENAQEGMIQKKKVGKIKPFIADKEFDKRTGKTIFSVRNTSIIVSYIKLNDQRNQINDGGIMFITAVPIHKGIEGIEQETHDIVKGNREDIINQIDLIEKKDSKQIEIQSTIRKEIETIDGHSFEEENENGKKSR